MTMTMDECRTRCRACHACGLREGCTQVVVDGGVQDAPIWLVGEAPGASEDEQGYPFVGRSGVLLDQFLQAAGLSRQKNIYITNIVKCRPPQNRDPAPQERDACMVWLRRQFVLLAPRIVVCLGRIAAQKLIRPDFSVTREHGQWEEKNGVFFTATWHPAALLRNPENKADSFGDYVAVRDKAREICPEIFAE